VPRDRARRPDGRGLSRPARRRAGRRRPHELARIDGKSKVEYIRDEQTKEFVRDLARGVILSEEPRVGPTLAAIAESLAAPGTVEGACPS
jgi:hypothetical protein